MDSKNDNTIQDSDDFDKMDIVSSVSREVSIAKAKKDEVENIRQAVCEENKGVEWVFERKQTIVNKWSHWLSNDESPAELRARFTVLHTVEQELRDATDSKQLSG